MSESKLKQLQQQLGYTFSSPELLQRALTHRSAAREHNERLEFLGDALLGSVIAALLHEHHANATEGDLSRMRSALVNGQMLASIARELALGDLLQLGAGERKSGGRERDSILSDAVEAIIGAVYLDGGFPACEQLVHHLFEGRLQEASPRDPKTELQELMQARGLPLPVYRVLEISGEEHSQVFRVACTVSELDSATEGSGRSRRVAERNAAIGALAALGKDVLLPPAPSSSRGI